MRGKADLEWIDTVAPPDDKKSDLQQMQLKIQTAVSGFFQFWDGYANGSVIPIPDNSVTVTKSGDGVHMSGRTNGGTIDEDYDKNMLLTNVLITTPTLKVLSKPIYVNSHDGRLLSSLNSLVHMPPTAPEVEMTYHFEYSKVDSYEIPSHIALDIKNVGIANFGFSNCKVTVANWAKKN